MTGRAVLNADGNVVYLFIADANRARIKEPGIPPHAPDFVPPLAELLEAEVSTMATTGSIGAYPVKDGDIHPVADPVTWARARAADVPMMCHSTGMSVEACLWLDPATGQMEMLFERGA
ncbi:MAG TPA: hypothetical protein PL096_04345 [Micropepsaceae bacterium]|nr:hypothetical protein [Micropepsaceae bacterium]